MSEETVKTPDAEVLKQKKVAHDYLATACHIIKTRVQFYHEEFMGVFETVSFLENMKAQILKDIEAAEPPKPEAPKAPYVVDVPMKPSEF